MATPGEQSIRVLDASTLMQKAKLTLPGNREGSAVDTKRGRFYTSLQGKDRTVAVDVKTHETVDVLCGVSETLRLIVDMADAEGHCCRFLRFVLTVEPAAGPIRLDVTGPAGAQEFVEALLEAG